MEPLWALSIYHIPTWALWGFSAFILLAFGIHVEVLDLLTKSSDGNFCRQGD